MAPQHTLLHSQSNCFDIFLGLERKKERKKEKMLAIFKKGVIEPPQELNSPTAAASSKASPAPKPPQQTLNDFLSSHPSNALSLTFGNVASLAYVPPQKPYSIHNRLFCGLDGIYCVFLGSLNNMCSLIKNYGLSKGANEAVFVIEAYRTLRDRGPCPANQVLRELEGSFGFLVYDSVASTVFVARSVDDDGVKLFWGIGADESVVISDNLEVIKGSCAKSFAPFPTGCMFHSEKGLMSFEHPKNKMKAMTRVDSEGFVCGANFKVDIYKKSSTMPRVGSETNWEVWGPQV